MRIVIVSCCTNHAATVEQTVQHNAEFCDAIVVLDRHSTDGSREMSADLAHGGWPVVVFDTPRLGGSWWDHLRRVCRNASRFLRPDRILILEADEFIVCEGRSVMEEELQRFDSDEDVAVACRVFRKGVLHKPDPSLAEHQPVTENWEYDRLPPCGRLSQDSPAGQKPSSTPDRARAKQASTFFLAKAQVEAESVSLQPRQDSKDERAADGSALLLSPILKEAIVADGEPTQQRTRWSESVASQPSESGSLGAEFHEHNLYLDLPPFRYLWDVYRPDSVLDLGCGLGGYIETFNHWGAKEVLGADDFEEPAGFLAKGCYKRLDLRKSFDLGRKFELVICTEVLEHIDTSSESIVLRNITKHAEKAILFSAARPGQPGIGHINCKEPEDWLDKWTALGWVPDPFGTLAARSLSTFYWFRRNLILLVPAAGQSATRRLFAIDDLDSLEARYTPWFGEAPCVYAFPLAVELPPLLLK